METELVIELPEKRNDSLVSFKLLDQLRHCLFLPKAHTNQMQQPSPGWFLLVFASLKITAHSLIFVELLCLGYLGFIILLFKAAVDKIMAGYWD